MDNMNEDVPSTSRLNFGSKADTTSHVDQAADANPTPVSDDVAETTEAPAEVEEVVAVAEPEPEAATEPEADEPEAEVEDQPTVEAPADVEQDDQTDPVPEEAFEPEVVTDGTEEEIEPVEIAIEAPAATTNADGKSVKQLTAERQRLDDEIKSKTDAQKASVIAQIKVVVDTYGVTTEELVEALGGFKFRRKGTKAKQKYADPVTGSTWSGRGKEPAWIKGKNRSKFLVPSDQQTVNP